MLATRVRMCSGNKKKDDMSGSPGSPYLKAGNMNAGYFGVVSDNEFYTPQQICDSCGITNRGTNIVDRVDWLKFAYNGKILFVSTKNLANGRNNNWDSLNTKALVSGKIIVKDNIQYKARLITGNTGMEWESLIYGVHINTLPSWDNFDNTYLGIGTANSESANNGISSSWCQELVNPTNARTRGVTITDRNYSEITLFTGSAYVGWRPVLEVVI